MREIFAGNWVGRVTGSLKSFICFQLRGLRERICLWLFGSVLLSCSRGLRSELCCCLPDGELSQWIPWRSTSSMRLLRRRKATTKRYCTPPRRYMHSQEETLLTIAQSGMRRNCFRFLWFWSIFSCPTSKSSAKRPPWKRTMSM